MADSTRLTLSDLLIKEGLDPKSVFVLRHRPHEPELRKVLPWLAAEKPTVFNAYQQTQGAKLQRALAAAIGSGRVASFIGHRPGAALFVGLYAITGARPITYQEYWDVPAYVEMKSFGMSGWTPDDPRTEHLWFDLVREPFYEDWQGKLIIDWPPPERSWWRRAHRNEFAVTAILEDSALNAEMPEWTDLDFTWAELGVLPSRWRIALSHWRGIYYIFDTTDRMGYVGSAYGDANILGRWLGYAATGHGGNVLLRQRDPRTFRFTILQRVSPDTEPADVIRVEASWKDRLHSRAPLGLNDN